MEKSIPRSVSPASHASVDTFSTEKSISPRKNTIRGACLKFLSRRWNPGSTAGWNGDWQKRGGVSSTGGLMRNRIRSYRWNFSQVHLSAGSAASLVLECCVSRWKRVEERPSSPRKRYAAVVYVWGGGARTLPPCPITISREGILSNIITSPLWIARPFYRFRERRRARATPGAVDARPAPSRVSSWAKIWGEEGRRVGRRIPSASRPWIPRVPRFRRANEIRGTIYKAGNCKRVLITIAKNIARFGSSKRRNSTRFHVRRLSRATVAPRYRPFSRSSLNREWCDLQRVLRLAHGEWEREKLSGWILDRKVLFAGLIEFSKRWQDVVFDSCYW